MFANNMSRSASTVSLSILVVIEMFNAMNALSSSESLMTFPLWKNMKLVYAIILSMALHFAILYIPFLQGLFSIVPLNWTEWQAVVAISAPVMYIILSTLYYQLMLLTLFDSIIDEALKFVERRLYNIPAHAVDYQNGTPGKPKKA